MAIPPSLSTDDKRRFFNLNIEDEESMEWLFERARTLVLEQGDVLIMPPGIPIIHRPHNTDKCIIKGTMSWQFDSQAMLDVLAHIFWTLKYSGVTDESPQQLLPELLDELEQLVTDDAALSQKDPNHVRRFTRQVEWTWNFDELGIPRQAVGADALSYQEFKELAECIKETYKGNV